MDPHSETPPSKVRRTESFAARGGDGLSKMDLLRFQYPPSGAERPRPSLPLEAADLECSSTPPAAVNFMHTPPTVAKEVYLSSSIMTSSEEDKILATGPEEKVDVVKAPQCDVVEPKEAISLDVPVEPNTTVSCDGALHPTPAAAPAKASATLKKSSARQTKLSDFFAM